MNVVEIMTPPSNLLTGSVFPDIEVCVMAIEAAYAHQAEMVTVRERPRSGKGMTPGRSYLVREIEQYLWSHPDLQCLKGIGQVETIPEKTANLVGGGYVSTRTHIIKNGVAISRQALLSFH